VKKKPINSTIVFVWHDEGDWCILFIDGIYRLAAHKLRVAEVALFIAEFINNGSIKRPVTVHSLSRSQEWFDFNGDFPEVLPVDCWNEIGGSDS